MAMVSPRVLINHVVKHFFSDALGNLECAADSISILELAEHSEISVLIPHSDASAYHTLVST